MNDNKRITRWLTNDDKWLNDQKERIERQTKGKRKCIIISNDKGQKALFDV